MEIGKEIKRRAVVFMDNVPAHQLASIEPLIQSVGASVLYQSPYSPNFNFIEYWC
ncbi:transposase [Microcoleus vaginatus]|uniref:transposase n=1 Tax=Microcoleus vaginatus TaxID=119532 RepID=UPI00404082D1